ncbi:MAG: energy transducer TonB [Cycloclasticus sp. symbiont of Bathymodiolus heckerae]|nr:MAG: energy transducer TonB [Cycloclasticus sp. symbiont of Bathymodiolus heckerae]
MSSIALPLKLRTYRPKSVLLFVAISFLAHGVLAAFAYKAGLFSNEDTPNMPAKIISIALVEPTPIKPPPPVQPPKPTKIKKRIVTKAPSKKRIAPKPKPIKEVVKPKPTIVKPVAPASPLPTPVKKRVAFTAPQPSYQPKPKYPSIARRRGQEGIVVLEITIGNNGHVNRASVVQSSGSSALDRAAIKTIKTWKFPASQFNSLSSFKQKIEFRLNSY